MDVEKRIDKVATISDWAIAQKYLRLHSGHNCGYCPKGIRTQMELYVLDKFDDFSEVFDTRKFRKNIAFLWGRNLGNRKEWEFGFNQEIISKSFERKKTSN